MEFIRAKIILNIFFLMCFVFCSTKASPVVWSILICTLEERRESFERIYSKIKEQITSQQLNDKIEVLFFRDNRENSVGFKRNKLLEESTGKYICFLDDDDDVHDQYISLIYSHLLEDFDCVSLTGIISYKGEHEKKFIHSIKYNTYFEENNIYFRPPNHLNPIKREIAIQFRFPEQSYGEDTDWALRLAKSELLKSEAVIEEPYYFYHCSDNPLSRYF